VITIFFGCVAIGTLGWAYRRDEHHAGSVTERTREIGVRKRLAPPAPNSEQSFAEVVL